MARIVRSSRQEIRLRKKAMNLFTRWIKFNAVGAIGVVIQLSALALMVACFDIHYLAATAIAVEAAIIHNYVWHEKWTWSEVTSENATRWLNRLLRFHVTNGFTSMVGNVLIMRSLVGTFQVPVLYANLTAIAICSLVNFLLSNFWVFQGNSNAKL